MVSVVTEHPKPLLVLNACEELLQVVIGVAGSEEQARPEVLFAEVWRSRGQSMTLLGPAMEHGLAGLGLKAGELGGIAVVRGPGSFTGLRIALATAAGMAMGAGLPLAGLEYLPLLADTAREGLGEPGMRLAVLTHARRGLVYYEEFGAEDGPAGTGPLRLLTLDEALQAVGALGQQAAAVLGSGVERLSGAGLALPEGLRVLPQALCDPSPTALLRAAGRAAYRAELPEPLYVRASDAEDNLPAIARARGIPAEEALRQLRDALGQR